MTSAADVEFQLLLVEDHPQLRKILSQALQAEGFRVCAAATATEAMQHFSDGFAADLLLSDIRMPGPVDGLRLAQWVREHYPHVAILLQTGFSETDQSEFQVLRKPFEAQELMDAIHRALADRAAAPVNQT